jgi:hypothetical protein
MLVLLKLKLNLIFEDLGRRFGISSSLACKIFNSWIPVLSDKLKSLIIWLPREVIRDCCPDSFRENYPRTTGIIDCAETFIQRPTNLRSRGETYSNYKSHNTVKYLGGIFPHGQIMFISKAFGGRASDKFIVEKSGFMNYLLLGDEIMADRRSDRKFTRAAHIIKISSNSFKDATGTVPLKILNTLSLRMALST